MKRFGFLFAMIAFLPGAFASEGPAFAPAGKAIEHTSVKDQGHVGFCWSYSTVARIESEFLRSSGQAVDLSEEYIGFFSLYEQILKLAPTYFTTMERKPGRSGFGADLLIYFLFHPNEGAPNLTLASDLVKRYGIVPESAFSYKIKGGFLQKTVEGRVRRFINRTLRDPVKNAEFRERNRDGSLSSRPNAARVLSELAKIYTLESEYDLPRAADAPCHSCELMSAMKEFEYLGARYTPKGFAKEYLHANSDEYEQIVVTKKNHAKAIARMQESIRDGYPVEVGITLFNGYGEAHKGSGILSRESCGPSGVCEAAGGHALLVVNQTVDPSTGKLNGIVVKNSWGTKSGRDSNGEVSGEKGYDIVTLDYLSELYRAKVQGEGARSWYLLVRKDSGRLSAL